MHNYYWTPTLGLDLAVIKAQAFRNANDKRYPSASTIHYHAHGEPCNGQHDHYPIGCGDKEVEDGEVSTA